MEYIEIEKDLIPYRFDLSIADEMFTWEVHYNPDYDFFTVDLFKDGETLVYGEKLVYGQTLFYDVQDNRFPKIPIVPFDLSEHSSAVTWETLGVSVFLYLLIEEDGSDG
ncbi:hypothetical protein NST69_27565 [Paenibacillus sp. FSL P2-0089]|uniref:phage baseplate plug family protein n=1 Tax=Paenibacillus sp. FSL P2-0089 TaxID=2954526 RepID=UPI00315AB39B